MPVRTHEMVVPLLLSVAFSACADGPASEEVDESKSALNEAKRDRDFGVDGAVRETFRPDAREVLRGRFDLDDPVREVLRGKFAFDNALPNTNGRSCATCHVEGEHLTLLPASVKARFKANPSEPLFNIIDSDDPTAAAPTFVHLQAGLIRVNIVLPDTIDLIDDKGNVVTTPDRTISLWRSVPTAENVKTTGPYQLDGRAPTLQAQALGALQGHSQITHDPPKRILKDIAEFESTVFSSRRVAAVALALQLGRKPPDPNPPVAAGSPEAAGKELFQKACATCHGGPTGNKLQDPGIAAELHAALNLPSSIQCSSGPEPDGSTYYVNVQSSLATFLSQVGAIPNFLGVDIPLYRVRFYTDETRTETLVDLPNGRATPDPGRALISGNPCDFEAFDIPQLYGMSHTAPYFHDNFAPDLETMIDFYSRLALPAITSLGFPAVVPTGLPAPAPPYESLTPDQKANLIAYLKKI